MNIQKYAQWLRDNERSDATIEKYTRDMRALRTWLGGREITRERLVKWKEDLLASGLRHGTVNGMLSALNSYLDYVNRRDCRVRRIRVQHTVFRDEERELSMLEYIRLLEAAEESGQDRTRMILQTMASTGIRVSELQFITVESADIKRAQVFLKGKSRTVVIPVVLAERLMDYAREEGIESGPIFVTRFGNAMSRQQVWSEMKRLCDVADVPKSKIFPHNLRHLFARTLYAETGDIAGVADVLGHSSVETTRIYLMTTAEAMERKINQLRMIY